jgi:hypothetical protein
VSKFSGLKSGLQESPLGDAWKEGEKKAKAVPQRAVNGDVGLASHVLDDG